MKYCSGCGLNLPLTTFTPKGKKCMVCVKSYNLQHKRSLSGLFTSIYANQRNSSRYRQHDMPDYSLKEFREHFINNPAYIQLHTDWVKSNYAKACVPSFDRLNDDLPYTLSNIQLTTWKANEQKQRNRIKAGIAKTDKITAVAQYDLSGNWLKEYPSIAIASRSTGIMASQIARACLDSKKSSMLRIAKGYKWGYV